MSQCRLSASRAGGLGKGVSPEEAGGPDPVTETLGYCLFVPSLPRGFYSTGWAHL